jgi:hypothetical protein
MPKRDDPAKPRRTLASRSDTKEDVRADLLDLVVEHLRRHAKKNALALKSIKWLPEDVDNLLKIFSKDKKLRMWVDSVISPPDRNGKIRLVDGAELRQHHVSDFWDDNSGGTTYLAGALWAAYTIGGLAPKDKAEKTRIEQILVEARATKAEKQRPAVIEKTAKLAEMCKHMTVAQIAKRLHISKGAARQRLRRANLHAQPEARVRF